jgi:5-methylcytosine-specific restriction endonuclease McrA
VAVQTGTNAVENNVLIIPGLIAAGVGGLKVAGVVDDVLDGWEAYEEEGGIGVAKVAARSIAERLIPGVGDIKNLKSLGKLGARAGKFISKSKIIPNKNISINLKFKEGMNQRDFDRKIKVLQSSAKNGKLYSNVPHKVSPQDRRKLTREYRRDAVNRINSLYKNNPQAQQNALTRLRKSDIDHIIDLQLGGKNIRSNLKSLDAKTNQNLGGQISRQLPKNNVKYIKEVLKK